MTERVVIVGCVAGKAATPRPARSLYVGQLWRARREYAEGEVAAERATAWAILSARYGVVEPGQVLRPYDTKLSDLRDAQRHAMALVSTLRLARQLGRDVTRLQRGERLAGVTIELHAGAPYVESVAPYLRAAGATIGAQLGWYRRERERRAA